MNFLTKYSAVVFERLILKLETIAYTAKRSAVHQARVDMKRIHSLLYLVNHMQEGRKLTEPVFLRKVFDAAGELREVQVEMKHLLKWNIGGKESSKAIFNKWTELERANSLKLQRAVNQPGQKTLEMFHDRLDKRLSQLDRDQTIRFLQEKYGELQSGNKDEKLKRRKLHKLRKILKNFLYILEALDNPKEKKAGEKKWMADLVHGLDLLGKWHDLEIAVSRLKDFQRDATPEFSALYSELLEKIKRMRRKYFKKAEKATGHLLSQDLILT